MAPIGDIPIKIEGEPAPPAEYGNALPVLSQVRHALAQLVQGGESTQIDLGAMPFGPGDEERLMALLGTGEVTATVDALGLTHIQETAFSGVWIVEYLNTDGQRVALHLEVDHVPQLLRSQPEDLGAALAALNTQLAGAPDAT
ncbi:hydrogenase expression/formation C-terminal domain-containing protein [Thiohalocapsa halophila]|jgi:hydrogenase-1 operon protein HyaF